VNLKLKISRSIPYHAALMLLFVCMNAAAQDLHFSQFMNSPLTTNPANAGFIPEADYRIGANYRQQWTSIPVPYKTMSVWGDVQVFRNRFENGWMGVGGVILSDVAGRGNLRSNKVYGSVAYHQMLGLSSLLSAGFNVGVANKRVDLTKFTFDNQWNGKFFDGGIPSGEFGLVNPNTTYLDLQVGMNYAYFPNEKTYINTGVSVQHVNEPVETFFTGADNKLARRYIGFLNGSFKMSDMLILNPNAYFSYQTRATELVMGGNAAYNLAGDGSKVLILGAYYRLNDAAIAMAGFEMNNIRFTLTYDATNSQLRNFNNTAGAYEFSLIRSGFYNDYFGDKRQSLCPRF